MVKWEPFTVIGVHEAPAALKALRKNKPQYSWRSKKVGGMAGMFAFLRIEKRKK